MAQKLKGAKSVKKTSVVDVLAVIGIGFWLVVYLFWVYRSIWGGG
jgi:hypothetical protein